MSGEFSGRQLLDGLLKLKSSSGSMANLRRGLHGNTTSKMSCMTVLWKFLPSDTPDHLLDLCRAVASFYATHPMHTNDNVSMGIAMAKLAGNNPDSFGRRFERLLESSRERAVLHIEGMIKMLSQNGIPINYEKLFDDLKFWSPTYKTRSVQMSWARDFFSYLRKDKENSHVES